MSVEKVVYGGKASENSIMESFKNIIRSGCVDEADEQALKEKYEAKIRAKLEAGKRLSAKEMQYLKKYNPVLYMHALRIEAARRSVEERLKHAKSKREVQDIKEEAVFAVGKKDPVRQYIIAAIEDAVKEFKETDEYRRLPEVEEKRNNRAGAVKGEPSIVYEFGEGAYQMAFVEEGL